MVLLKIIRAWAIVGSVLGNIPRVQVPAVTTNFLGGPEQGASPLSDSSSAN